MLISEMIHQLMMVRVGDSTQETINHGHNSSLICKQLIHIHDSPLIKILEKVSFHQLDALCLHDNQYKLVFMRFSCAVRIFM